MVLQVLPIQLPGVIEGGVWINDYGIWVSTNTEQKGKVLPLMQFYICKITLSTHMKKEHFLVLVRHKIHLLG